MTVLFFEKKSRQKKLRLSGIITAPLCKGSSAEGGEGLFFYNLSTTSWSPSPYTGEANSEPLSARPASVLRTLANPLCKGSCRRKPTEGLFFYNPSTTSWSPSPYTGEAQIKPLSATPASVLRTLANPFTQGSLLINCASFRSSLSSFRSKKPRRSGAFCSFIFRNKLLRT